MAKIKVLRESNLGNTSSTDKVYPVTSSDAVYVPDKGKLTDILSTIGSTKYYKEDVETQGGKTIGVEINTKTKPINIMALNPIVLTALFSEIDLNALAININKDSDSPLELISSLKQIGDWIVYFLQANNNLYNSLKNLESLYNELTDRVDDLDSKGDEHWHSPVKPPEPTPPTPPTPTGDIEVEITGNILAITADNLTVTNNILSIPYESVTVNNSILILE